MNGTGNRRSNRRQYGLKAALLVGFGALVFAFVTAHNSPATGYEVSIYSGTPLLYWVGLSIALLVAIGVAIGAYDNRLGSLALLLAVLGVLSIFALPIIRGYLFYGHGDSLHHLGWARDIADGMLAPQEMIYPGFHMISVFLAAVGGVEMTQSMLYVTLLVKLLFVVFVPLALYVLYSNRKAIFVGVFSGFLMMPINHISTHESFHTFSMTILFTAFIYYLLFAHVTKKHVDEALPRFLSPTGLVLPVALVAVVFLHPQAAFNVLLLFGTITLVQFVYRRRSKEHAVSQMRGIYGQFVLLAVVFALWAGQFENTYRVLDLMITGVQETITGNEEAGQVVQQHGESTAAAGASLAEIFVKLFGVSTIYSLLAGGLVLSVLSSRFQARSQKTDGVVIYFAYGGLVLIPFLGVHFLGDIDAYLFRQVGFGMVLVTILGAIALFHVASTPFRRDLRPVLGVATVVVLAAALLVAFASPFILLPNAQVTETEMNGYDTLLENQDKEVRIFGGVRMGAGRFINALQYSEDGRDRGPEVFNETVFNGGVTGVYDTDKYLVISQYDRTRDLEVYNGFRYTEAGFERIKTTDGVHRVQSNGDVNVYYIDE
ncbi:hypothetical protein ACFQGE_17655 [Halomicroarcula sp. GCM10025817]|uniref:hypothetical protein n=2 Tax=Haloarcula TaxID=2237 RepID=UPI003608EF01